MFFCFWPVAFTVSEIDNNDMLPKRPTTWRSKVSDHCSRTASNLDLKKRRKVAKLQMHFFCPHGI